MEADGASHVYDFIEMDLGFTLATVQLPSLGNARWRSLGKFQIKRLQERDHMVIYVSVMGTSWPYKFCEESPDGSLYRYTRRGQHDLYIKRSVKASLVTFHDQSMFSLNFIPWACCYPSSA